MDKNIECVRWLLYEREWKEQAMSLLEDILSDYAQYDKVSENTIDRVIDILDKYRGYYE